MSMIPRSRSIAPALVALAIASGGCSKLKSLEGGGAGGENAEGGAASTTADGLALPDGFQGEIDVTAKDEKPTEKDTGQPVNLALLVKSGKIRVDIPEQLAKQSGAPMAENAKGYGVFDSAVKKIYVVLDSSKQVIVVDLNKVGEQFKGMTPPSHPDHGGAAPKQPTEAPPKVTKTGKNETIAGYKCEDWDVATDHREATICVAEQGFSWLSLPMGALNGVPTEHLWMAELLDGKHFPLRFVGYDKDGTTETARVEVTKLDAKTLPDADFTYPPNYAVIDLEQMLKGFGAMGGAGGGMPGGGMPGMPGGFPMPHRKAQ
jgi:hypothetical protein